MTPLTKFVLFAGFAAAVYGVVAGNLPETIKATAKLPPAAGWEQLDACSPMQSLDGTRELTFLKNYTVKLLEREAKTQRVLGPNKAVGVWAFDEPAKRYFVTLAQQQKSYSLVQPENSEVCILIYGELAAANIGESWFSRTQDVYDDSEAPDRF
jgi:hypothetical protein